MLRTTKPKNARSKRVLEKREAKLVENPKTAIFVRGNQSSEKVNLALTELAALKKPDAISFSKKNDIHPFESTTSLEFFSAKNDASLFVVGHSQKKRPDNLVWARMFDGQVLDMIEVGITQATSMKEFKTTKPGVGMRPCFHFSGALFDNHPAYAQLKSVLLDFYRGEEVNSIALAGLQHVVSVTAAPVPESNGSGATATGAGGATGLAGLYEAAGAGGESLAPTGTVHLRVYSVSLLASGQRAPRVELKECGPSFDFVLRRRREAAPDMLAQALKRPKTAAEKNTQGKGKRKNIETDDMGDMVGRVHLGRQDLSSLQTRKMKGLRVRKGEDDSEEEDGDEDDGDDGEDGGEELPSDIEELEMEDMTAGDSEGDDGEGDEDEGDDDEAPASKGNGTTSNKRRRG